MVFQGFRGDIAQVPQPYYCICVQDKEVKPPYCNRLQSWLGLECAVCSRGSWAGVVCAIDCKRPARVEFTTAVRPFLCSPAYGKRHKLPQFVSDCSATSANKLRTAYKHPQVIDLYMLVHRVTILHNKCYQLFVAVHTQTGAVDCVATPQIYNGFRPTAKRRFEFV
jgi:hypothetical protein